jgi:hypothetical protein
LADRGRFQNPNVLFDIGPGTADSQTERKIAALRSVIEDPAGKLGARKRYLLLGRAVLNRQTRLSGI